MGLFDPLIIPAQQGDWIYVEWYPKNNCDMIQEVARFVRTGFGVS